MTMLAFAALGACSGPAREEGGRSGVMVFDVLCLEYAGETDRPVLPVVVSGSEASLKAYVAFRGNDALLAHGSMLVITPEGMSCLRKALPALRKPDESSAVLTVRLWARKEGERRGSIAAVGASEFLSEAKRCLEQSSRGSGESLNTLLSFVAGQ